MSFFTIKETEMHWNNSRKIPRLSIVAKTLDCGRKFKEERDVVETLHKQKVILKDYNSFLLFLFLFWNVYSL